MNMNLYGPMKISFCELRIMVTRYYISFIQIALFLLQLIANKNNIIFNVFWNCSCSGRSALMDYIWITILKRQHIGKILHILYLQIKGLFDNIHMCIFENFCKSKIYESLGWGSGSESVYCFSENTSCGPCMSSYTKPLWYGLEYYENE